MADSDSTPGRSPAFQFYPKDYLSDVKTRVMSFRQRGMYWELISHCWLEGGLPAEPSEIGRILGILTPGKFETHDWPIMSRCFRLVDGMHQHPRLDREREKQRLWSDKSAAGGRKAQAKRNQEPTTLEPPLQPNTDSSSSSSSSDFSPECKERTLGEPPPVDARSKRPIFQGQRFVVFEWMLDDLRKLLGKHTDEFDLHAWFFTLDGKVADESIVVPQRDGGRWLQEQTLAEAERRGFLVARAQSQTGKTAGNLGNLQRFAAKGKA